MDQANLGSGVTPGALTVDPRCQNIHVDVHIIDDLEVVHSDTQEVGTRLEGEPETIVGTNRSRRKDFESNPRLWERIHKFLDPLRVPAIDVVMFRFV